LPITLLKSKLLCTNPLRNANVTNEDRRQIAGELRHVVGIELLRVIFQIFIWQSAKGRCYGNQLNMGDVCKRCVESPLLFGSVFDNGLADHKSSFKRFNGNNRATSYPNLVNFCPVILEFTLLKRAIFCHILPAI